MATNLFAASKQWATRPADERFETLTDMHTACRGWRDSAATASVRMNTLECRPGPDGNLLIAGPAGAAATLTHWSFGQLANRCSAPAEYLRGLPQELAATNINHGLRAFGNDVEGKILFHRNGSLVARCVTSDAYSRICGRASRVRRSIGWRR